jgi:hypothetical protein
MREKKSAEQLQLDRRVTEHGDLCQAAPYVTSEPAFELLSAAVD